MADHRHKRDTDARRKPRAAIVAGPLAVLATASAVTLGVVATAPDARDLVAEDASADLGKAAPGRDEPVSRSEARFDPKVDSKKAQRKLQRRFDINMAKTATLRAIRAADTRLWTTTALNLWTAPGAAAENVGLLEAGKRVLVTGRRTSQRVELVVNNKSRWVTAGYLAKEKPEPPATEASGSSGSSGSSAPAGLSMEPCPDSSVESGLTADAIYVYRSVCHAFPQITSYGGWDGHGEHASGRALDIMTSDVALGDSIAAFLQAHAAELNLYDILWRQRIWTPVRASEGWRWMASRGSATADHYDHVHVSTNG